MIHSCNCTGAGDGKDWGSHCSNRTGAGDGKDWGSHRSNRTGAGDGKDCGSLLVQQMIIYPQAPKMY